MYTGFRTLTKVRFRGLETTSASLARTCAPEKPRVLALQVASRTGGIGRLAT